MEPFDLLPRLWAGAVTTISLTFLSAGLALVIAVITGLGRLSSHRTIRVLAGVYVETFRGTSLLVQIFFMAFVLPLMGLSLPLFVAGMLALALNTGAYGSEVVRGAILAVEKGQREAAVALNMTHWLMMRRIVIPQAVPRMLPPFGNLLIELMKGTALVSLVGIAELAFVTQQIIQTDGMSRQVDAYVMALLMYLVLAVPIIFAFRRIERRANQGFSTRPTG